MPHSFQGIILIPGDKSISHRAVILAALSKGISRLSHFLKSEDCLHTLKALNALGVVSWWDEEDLLIQGIGEAYFKPPEKPLDFGNSGTGLRLMAGLLAGQPFDSTLTGDVSLCQRPMDRIIDPLRAMGANITGTLLNNKTVSPLKIKGGQALQGIRYSLPVASAQVKSCLLLAGRFAQGNMQIQESESTRDHTERLLKKFKDTGKGALTACNLRIPGDISSAAFFMVAATLMPNSHLILKSVGVNSTRMGIIHILRSMGANIELKLHPEENWEPIADIVVKSSPLQGIMIPSSQVVSAIDEFPILFIAAAFAKKETVLRGALELRVKESDRLAVMANNLIQLGFKVEQFSDGLRLEGIESFEPSKTPVTIDPKGDHRIAMAFSIAAHVLKDRYPEMQVTIEDTQCINTSFPNFIDLLTQSSGPKLI